MSKKKFNKNDMGVKPKFKSKQKVVCIQKGADFMGYALSIGKEYEVINLRSGKIIDYIDIQSDTRLDCAPMYYFVKAENYTKKEIEGV